MRLNEIWIRTYDETKIVIYEDGNNEAIYKGCFEEAHLALMSREILWLIPNADYLEIVLEKEN